MSLIVMGQPVWLEERSWCPSSERSPSWSAWWQIATSRRARRRWGRAGRDSLPGCSSPPSLTSWPVRTSQATWTLKEEGGHPTNIPLKIKNGWGFVQYFCFLQPFTRVPGNIVWTLSLVLVVICEMDFHVFWWLWQFLHHVVTVTVSPPSGDCDSFSTIWWLWQFLHHVVTVTVSPPSGDCDSFSTMWWLWQFLHHVVTVTVSPPCGDCDSFSNHLVTVTVSPPSGDCDSFSTMWWLWQFLHHVVTVTVSPTMWWLWQFLYHLVTVTVSPPSGDCDSFSTIWWLWQFLHHLMTVTVSPPSGDWQFLHHLVTLSLLAVHAPLDICFTNKGVQDQQTCNMYTQNLSNNI